MAVRQTRGDAETGKGAGRKARVGRKRRLPELITDPVQAAEAAGLEYVSDDEPGIRRKRAGKSWSYIGLDGKPIKDASELKRLRSLAIPPAWTDVWISPNPNGHIQATARDAKGRKQYRYHPRWREARDETKYTRMILFGHALPHIRERVEHDLARSGLPKQKVLAAVVRLLEETHIRVGNDEYATKNNSYGLTTMLDEHVNITGTKVEFEFRGKSGKDHQIDIKDRRLASIVKRCQELPGQRLFQYLDENGETLSISSGDVNAYLKEITGEDFTAKDFRTWAGTILAAEALWQQEPSKSQTAAKKVVVQAIDNVAGALGNTRAVCRKSYIHPNVIQAYMDGTLRDILERHAKAEGVPVAGLRPEERALLGFLEDCAA